MTGISAHKPNGTREDVGVGRDFFQMQIQGEQGSGNLRKICIWGHSKHQVHV